MRFQRSATPIKRILPPLEQGQELAVQAEAALGEDGERAGIEALAAHLDNNASARDLYMQVLPRISVS